MRRAPLALAVWLLASAAFAQDDSGPSYRPAFLFNQHLYFGTFARPHGVEYDAEHKELWIADTGNGIVGIYRPDGTELYSFTSKFMRDPVRVAIASKNRVAVIEGDRTHVRLFNYRGDYKGDVALEKLETKPIIGAVAYDSDGNLYVAENRSAQIFVYAPDGKLRRQFGSRGSDEGQFESVCAIVVGSDGTIYVADQRALAIQLFDNQGNFIRGWGRHEMGGEHVSLPSGLAIDSNGRIFLTDELRHQVKVFSPEGKLLTQFGGLGSGLVQLSFPTDVAVDSADRIYVSELGNSRVQVFEPVPAAQP